MEAVEKAFNEISKRTEGKLSEGIYLQRYHSISEMLKDLELTLEEVEKNKFYLHDVLPKGPFIVKDYNQEEFVFLTEFDEDHINEFVEFITRK